MAAARKCVFIWRFTTVPCELPRLLDYRRIYTDRKNTKSPDLSGHISSILHGFGALFNWGSLCSDFQYSIWWRVIVWERVGGEVRVSWLWEVINCWKHFRFWWWNTVSSHLASSQIFFASFYIPFLLLRMQMIRIFANEIFMIYDLWFMIYDLFFIVVKPIS